MSVSNSIPRRYRPAAHSAVDRRSVGFRSLVRPTPLSIGILFGLGRSQFGENRLHTRGKTTRRITGGECFLPPLFEEGVHHLEVCRSLAVRRVHHTPSERTLPV